MTRDPAIDGVRGLCIFSMVIGHICFGSTVWRIVHPVPWIDGASGFVLLAGLVLGMVSRRRVDSAGVVRSQILLMRRMALLYVAHVGVTTLAVVVSPMTPHTDPGLADIGEASPAQMAWWLATMQINPDRVDILSMYVALLALAAVWVWALSRRWWPLVGVSSAVLYTAAVTLDWGRFPNRPDGWAYFNTAAWQALFGVAFVAGWYWSRLRDPLRGRAALAIASGGGLLVAAAGVALHHFGTGAWLFDKANCGPGRILLALAAFVVLYQMMRFAIAYVPRLVAPVVLVGSRSLACFVALCVAGTLLPLAIGYHPTSAAAQIAAVLTLLAMYPVARARGAAGTALARRR
ncbi:OpgC domain-containing protein [Mycobacterium sp. 236(2023)]|uniref:OpgC domain-containing protein n=1 Tax=Mycobacterium sp. 236(2023) TaxID=3038163 RepID=UPI0024155189|nr:OpgC domain-containing protein [Mycobacterium sp. 236(2023)]MDG4664570.1 OpgC domain-containing protein [Mycobacterium sp. 236(2023)]